MRVPSGSCPLSSAGQPRWAAPGQRRDLALSGAPPRDLALRRGLTGGGVPAPAWCARRVEQDRPRGLGWPLGTSRFGSFGSQLSACPCRHPAGGWCGACPVGRTAAVQGRWSLGEPGAVAAPGAWGRPAELKPALQKRRQWGEGHTPLQGKGPLGPCAGWNSSSYDVI